MPLDYAKSTFVDVIEGNPNIHFKEVPGMNDAITEEGWKEMKFFL